MFGAKREGARVLLGRRHFAQGRVRLPEAASLGPWLVQWLLGPLLGDVLDGDASIGFSVPRRTTAHTCMHSLRGIYLRNYNSPRCLDTTAIRQA